MTNLDSIFKSRDITLPTKVHLVKAMVFPVVMYGCESWTIKNAECRGMMHLNCGVGEDSWESLGLQGDLEGLMLKLKLQYFGHLMRRVDSLEDSDAGRDWGQEEKGTIEDEMAGWHQGLDGCESE